MALEVIGAGLARTGTLSLKTALEQLGYVKCHHMVEVMGNRKQIDLWNDVVIEGSGDWDSIFEGFRASVDLPSVKYYLELMEHFPDAKVILTVRDPDSWYRSTRETIYAFKKTSSGMKWIPRLRKLLRMVDGVYWDGVFHGQFEDVEASKSIFRKHIEDVKASVPAERLLVFNVRDGWGPLCELLDQPVPANMPFPHVNDTASLRKTLRVMQLVRILPYAVGAVILLWVGLTLFS